MKLNLKMLAVSTALLGLLAAGAALPASAAGPLNAAAALSLPWSAAAVESVETGSYASTMTVGTQQQLSPVILPAKAARNATVTFMSNDSTIVNVTSEGVAQAVGVGTAQVIASADGVSCVYTITTELDESMIVKEMDITLASSTIAVGETTSLSLGVLPSSASNYASVSLSSSDPAVATVNNFGKVTGVAPGTATITATCGDVSASATVKVVNSGVDRQSIDLNTSYVVLKPGASRTIAGKVTPSSASQSLTFKSNDTKVATVSAKGVITAVGTGATSIVVSNGTASASVTVIVNRNASSSGNGGGSTDDSNGEVITDPVVEAIEADGTDEVTFAQRDVPTITGEMLNALRLNGKTLVVEADNYTIRIDNGRVAELLSNDYRPGVQNLSMNLYIIERESLIQLVRDASVRGLVYFERDILARNLSLLNVQAYEFDGYLARISDMKSYFDENMRLLQAGNVDKLFNEGNPIYTKIRDDNPTRYLEGSKVKNSLLADGCVVEGTVENSVLFRGCQIKKGAVVRNCVLMQDTVVEENSSVEYVVTDKNVHITADKKLIGTDSFPVFVAKRHTV